MNPAILECIYWTIMLFLSLYAWAFISGTFGIIIMLSFLLINLQEIKLLLVYRGVKNKK